MGAMAMVASGAVVVKEPVDRVRIRGLLSFAQRMGARARSYRQFEFLYVTLPAWARGHEWPNEQVDIGSHDLVVFRENLVTE
jgi:hypothetical protein